MLFEWRYLHEKGDTANCQKQLHTLELKNLNIKMRFNQKEVPFLPINDRGLFSVGLLVTSAGQIILQIKYKAVCN